MQHTHPPILDIVSAACVGTALQGRTKLFDLKRLLQESQDHDGERLVQWSVQLNRQGAQVREQSAWLHLTAEASLEQICQRCLLPVEVALHVDRQFRFVASEAIAEQQDEDCEEDLLVTSRTFDLAALIEDEVLMELPLVPSHINCPVPVKTAFVDAGFDSQTTKPKPFAALAGLKIK